MARCWTFVALVLALTVLPAQSAFAHAQLLSANPIENTVLDVAPGNVELHFNEPVSPLAISLIGPDGSRVDLLEATTGGETVSVAMPAAMPMGTSVVSWRVVSTDGHPIGGSLVFSVGSVTGAAGVAPLADGLVTALLWFGKALLFIGLFVGIGGALYRAIAPTPPLAKRVAILACGLGLVAAGATLGLQGLDALGLSLGASTDFKVWRAGFSTSYGVTALVIAFAFVLSLVSLRSGRGRLQVLIAVLAATGAALAMALRGHASAAAPQWLTRPAVFLHISGILFWVGALLPLWLHMRSMSAEADRSLAQFSRIVPYAVGAILISGIVLGGIQMGWPGPHWLTPYAAILAAKLGLLAMLFGLALWNRTWLTQPALAGDAKARRRLGQSIGVESMLILLILALVAGWRFTPPPRALANVIAATPAEPIMLHLGDETTMAMVTIAPGQAGPVSLEIWLTDIEGEPILPQEVTITMSAPDLGIEPFKRPATLAEAIWHVDDLSLPVAGLWRVEVDIRASRFELIRLGEDVLIP